MRCVIARFPFDLTKSEVEHSMRDVTPEPAVGTCVTVGSEVYPVKQVGEIVTRQDRRDFTAAEMHRALTRLGFTCHDAVVTPAAAPAGEVSAEGWGW
ncbi:SCO5918 family protein [Streptomyces longwoodensis]|uniref:Uncharacterized protein n=1 Tax=Streptomyces lasalocidi TaxID=324833 RepID=A0A4U5WIM6_STRLS|nr:MULTISPECIES: SCO5918 family protein [Streptomyces]MCX4994918.1 SCO5918 family protein [Streptomyces longwoodensis]TKT01878.1 hypothetical protein E4U91_18435 [Streptomyces lasalocidi]WRY89730.1 SCO5918 family protein [Streptomyces longwoodensis]WTI45977.1 SCO5918 family protein [Streptomyces longwoodensis]WUC58786.1 SCO5918 family protein [Streptomyces longwoodensis]